MCGQKEKGGCTNKFGGCCGGDGGKDKQFKVIFSDKDRNIKRFKWDETIIAKTLTQAIRKTAQRFPGCNFGVKEIN